MSHNGRVLRKSSVVRGVVGFVKAKLYRSWAKYAVQCRYFAIIVEKQAGVVEWQTRWS